jgi:hypothetical protein
MKVTKWGIECSSYDLVLKGFHRIHLLFSLGDDLNPATECIRMSDKTDNTYMRLSVYLFQNYLAY